MPISRLLVAAVVLPVVLAAGCDTLGSDPQYYFPFEVVEAVWLSTVPGKAEILPDGGHVLVSYSIWSSFGVVDLSSLAYLGPFPSGTSSPPWDFAVHPVEQLAYFCDGGSVISVVETDSFSVVDSISIPGFLTSVSVDDTGSYILTVNAPDQFLVIDLDSDSIFSSAEIPVYVSEMSEILYVPSASAAYISCGSDGPVVVVSVPDATVLATVPVGWDALAMCLLPTEKYVYVSGEPMTVIRTSDITVVDSIPGLPDSPQLAVLPSGEYLYCSDNGVDDGLAVVDTETNEIAVTIDLGSSPTGLAISPSGHQVYVAVAGVQLLVLE